MRIYAPPTFALGGGDYIMTPGADLEVGPGGKLYETLGEEEAVRAKANAQADAAMREPDEKASAQREISRMKRALRSWIKYRRTNDEVASGKRKGKVSSSIAAARLKRERDWRGEQKLADDLYLLLTQVYGAGDLPNPNVVADPNAAVKLALVAISGDVTPTGPQAQGIWPILILTVGGVFLFATTSYISNRAEVEKEKERMLCVRSGACTDYGFWLKLASVGVVGWFVWDKLGVRERVGALKTKRGRRR